MQYNESLCADPAGEPGNVFGRVGGEANDHEHQSRPNLRGSQSAATTAVGGGGGQGIAT